MKYILTITLLVGGWCILLVNLCAADLNEAQQQSVVTEQLFASPEEAVRALQSAAESQDKTALRRILGPQVRELLTGDETQDAKNAQKFSAVMAQGYTLVENGEDKITIETGLNDWPMPIPLVKAKGQWYFDTAAGKEEIINRHIGKDELHAIGVCRAYVTAQEQYAGTNPDASQGVKYAQKFNALASPFGSLVTEAQVYHGYYFRILTRQGKAAPGGRMNYMSHGILTRGFALLAYPAHWDQSGIMTFIVNQDGKVFQQNLGEKTSRIAGAMKEYNPNGKWTLVKDQGAWK